MTKRIAYLTFYFEPDLCAGSFRNSPLVHELSKQVSQHDESTIIDVFTTLPNRYSSFTADAPAYEERGNVRIHRISIPKHNSGFLDQILTFRTYYRETLRISRAYDYNLVFSSSSRLFTAYLGYKIAKKNGAKLYLDIRDIFVDTINDVLSSRALKAFVVPVLKFIEGKVFRKANHINLISEGFKPYFNQYPVPNYSYFTNGIDPEFLDIHLNHEVVNDSSKTLDIVYAGNIGEGQGLHKIIPLAAKQLGDDYRFIVIGDGGAKRKLVHEIEKLGLRNVELRPPVVRSKLIEEYLMADYLFLHLNDYAAFEKVLPSKIFELGVFNKPILAGVNGFARKFISDNLTHAYLFDSGDANGLLACIMQSKNNLQFNATDFKNKFSRRAVNDAMATSIISYL